MPAGIRRAASGSPASILIMLIPERRPEQCLPKVLTCSENNPLTAAVPSA
jgi:hypothetical protein